MDGFDDNFGQNDVDPAAEFLKREQDQLAGLEDEVTANAASDGYSSVGQADQLESFEMIDTLNVGNIPQSSVNGYHGDSFNLDESSHAVNNIEALPVDSTSQPRSITPPVREVPEKIKKWREEQTKRLEQKDAAEEVKKAELRAQAKKELDEWYKHHDELIGKNMATNRSAEKELVAEADVVEPGTEWERIAKLCDFNPKASKHSKDVSRMRSIILQLKQTPPVRMQ